MERIRGGSGGSGGQFGGGDRPKPEAEETESPRDAQEEMNGRGERRPDNMPPAPADLIKQR